MEPIQGPSRMTDEEGLRLFTLRPDIAVALWRSVNEFDTLYDFASEVSPEEAKVCYEGDAGGINAAGLKVYEALRAVLYVREMEPGLSSSGVHRGHPAI